MNKAFYVECLADYESALCAGATHREFFDVWERGGFIPGYAMARRVGVTHEEAVDAIAQNIPMTHYCSVRIIGYTHRQAADAHTFGVDLLVHRAAMDAGVPEDEALSLAVEARDEGADTEARELWEVEPRPDLPCQVAMAAGAAPTDILDADARGVELFAYANARAAGASHDEVLDAAAREMELYAYGLARWAGATHPETLEAVAHALTTTGDSLPLLGWYADARRQGTTHAEVLGIADRHIKLDHYVLALLAGATHREILDASERTDYLDWYIDVRESGASHAEFVKAVGTDAVTTSLVGEAMSLRRRAAAPAEAQKPTENGDRA